MPHVAVEREDDSRLLESAESTKPAGMHMRFYFSPPKKVHRPLRYVADLGDQTAHMPMAKNGDDSVIRRLRLHVSNLRKMSGGPTFCGVDKVSLVG